MAFIDFAEVKEKVSFADAMKHLELELKRSGNQWRGTCPACGGNDRGLVVTEGRGWYCWQLKKGGDVIALAAHILDIPAKQAAHELAQRAGIVPVQSGTVQSKSTVPESEGREGSKLSPLSYLEHDHEAVHAVGLSPEFCERQGIGYAPRGLVRGSIAIPFRDERGQLLGYFGVQELTYIPADFQPTNVVPFEKKRA